MSSPCCAPCELVIVATPLCHMVAALPAAPQYPSAGQQCTRLGKRTAKARNHFAAATSLLGKHTNCLSPLGIGSTNAHKTNKMDIINGIRLLNPVAVTWALLLRLLSLCRTYCMSTCTRRAHAVPLPLPWPHLNKPCSARSSHMASSAVSSRLVTGTQPESTTLPSQLEPVSSKSATAKPSLPKAAARPADPFLGSKKAAEAAAATAPAAVPVLAEASAPLPSLQQHYQDKNETT